MQEEVLLKALITSIEKTNDIVRDLSENVSELVTSEKVRIESDKRQQEINLELSLSIKEVDKKIGQFMTDNTDTLARTKRFHVAFDKVSTGVISLVVIGLLALLGFTVK